MVIFDSPTRETCTVRQGRTNTPLQALTLMNDTTYMEASRKLAERMMTEGGSGAEDRLAYGYHLVLARAPKPPESTVLKTTLERFQRYVTRRRGSALHRPRDRRRR